MDNLSTDDEFAVEIIPTHTRVSPFRPVLGNGVFIRDFPIDPGPLTHETFMQRRHHAARGEPVEFPLGSHPMAELTPIPSDSMRILDGDRPHSPATLGVHDLIFDQDRDYVVGYADPPNYTQVLGPTLAALPNVRGIWFFLNVLSLNLDRPTWMSSGFISGHELQFISLLRSIASYSFVRTFSSRLEVDLYFRDAAFSVQLEVQELHWLLVAPYFICKLVQDWASAFNNSPAIIRSHPDLGTAFEDLSSFLDSDGRLAFLSPLRHSSTLHPDQRTNLFNGSFAFPDLPQDYPMGRSHGCFRPVSMAILNSPFLNLHQDRKFTVISTEWGNSPARVDRCYGYSDMISTVSRTQGNSLVLPFFEGPEPTQCPLTESLLTWLPYFCWPSPSQDSSEVASEILSSILVPPIVIRSRSSQVSLGSEGSA